MAKAKRRRWIIDEAMESGRLIEYQRAVLGSEVEQGFVVGIGRKWVLIHVLDGVRLDGYHAIREHDIARARLSRDRFRIRALALRGDVAVAPRDVDLDRTRDLLRSASRSYRIVGLNTEYDDPKVRYIGTVKKLGAHRFGLRGVSTRAKWKPVRGRAYRYTEISRVDFDDAYLNALLRVLDDRAAAKEP